jgi:hypothetical protein
MRSTFSSPPLESLTRPTGGTLDTRGWDERLVRWGGSVDGRVVDR